MNKQPQYKLETYTVVAHSMDAMAVIFIIIVVCIAEHEVLNIT